MRQFFFATLVAAALASIAVAPTPAEARDYPFCIKGADYDSAVGDCSFDTYDQCLASASGRRAFCDANPFYAGQPARVAAPRKRHPRQ